MATLDLRELPAPEPMLRALAAVDSLIRGSALRVLTPLRPEPLFEQLRSRRVSYATEALEGGGCAVTIWRDDGPAVN